MASNHILVVVVNCDQCNPNTLNWVPPAKSGERLKWLRKKAFPPAGFLVGTVKDALKEGWQEREFGIVCPACIEIERAQAQRDKDEQAESFIGVPAEAIDYDAELRVLDLDEKATEEAIAIWIEQNPEIAEAGRKDLAQYKREVAEVRAQIEAAKSAAAPVAVEGATGQKENEVE